MNISVLPWDVARCIGKNDLGECGKKLQCRRHTELDMANIFTMRFESPIDADLENGCQLLIEVNNAT